MSGTSRLAPDEGVLVTGMSPLIAPASGLLGGRARPACSSSVPEAHVADTRMEFVGPTIRATRLPPRIRNIPLTAGRWVEMGRATQAKDRGEVRSDDER